MLPRLVAFNAGHLLGIPTAFRTPEAQRYWDGHPASRRTSGDAASRAFGMAKLHEKILLELAYLEGILSNYSHPIRSLFVLQRVSRIFQKYILASPQLRRWMFLEHAERAPWPTADYLLRPIRWLLCHPQHLNARHHEQLMPPICGFDIVAYGPLQAFFALSPLRPRMLAEESATWKQIKLSRAREVYDPVYGKFTPQLKLLQPVITRPGFPQHMPPQQYFIAIDLDLGATLGDLYAYYQEMFSRSWEDHQILQSLLEERDKAGMPLVVEDMHASGPTETSLALQTFHNEQVNATATQRVPPPMQAAALGALDDSTQALEMLPQSARHDPSPYDSIAVAAPRYEPVQSFRHQYPALMDLAEIRHSIEDPRLGLRSAFATYGVAAADMQPYDHHEPDNYHNAILCDQSNTSHSNFASLHYRTQPRMMTSAPNAPASATSVTEHHDGQQSEWLVDPSLQFDLSIDGDVDPAWLSSEAHGKTMEQQSYEQQEQETAQLHNNTQEHRAFYFRNEHEA